MDQLKWGIVGSVERAKAFVADLKHTSKPNTLHGFFPTDHYLNTSDLIMDRVYDDFDQLLESNIDAVYIASSYKFHFAKVKQSLLHQKAVLCERPIAENVKQLKQLISLSEHNNTFMMEGMWIRFLPSIKKVLSIVSSGSIGEVASVKASLSYKQPVTEHLLNSGGGALFELGVFPVFLCTLLLGRPVYVQAIGKKSA
ncbi:MAG: Gfo/Idh/MocA family oxidoreductase, partial [Chitinophagaceae bacterium]|nr:Gfo/Idh/MocA family oxidoreductase [Chitinophagaceae bacterium]